MKLSASIVAVATTIFLCGPVALAAEDTQPAKQTERTAKPAAADPDQGNAIFGKRRQRLVLMCRQIRDMCLRICELEFADQDTASQEYLDCRAKCKDDYQACSGER